MHQRLNPQQCSRHPWLSLATASIVGNDCHIQRNHKHTAYRELKFLPSSILSMSSSWQGVAASHMGAHPPPAHSRSPFTTRMPGYLWVHFLLVSTMIRWSLSTHICLVSRSDQKASKAQGGMLPVGCESSRRDIKKVSITSIAPLIWPTVI